MSELSLSVSRTSTHDVSVRRLSSGYWHLRGQGPCSWAQPPSWPCSERVLREHAFGEASEEFIQSCLRLLPKEANDA